MMIVAFVILVSTSAATADTSWMEFLGTKRTPRRLADDCISTGHITENSDKLGKGMCIQIVLQKQYDTWFNKMG